MPRLDDLDHGSLNAAIGLALGRIFRLTSRPEQPGDVADFERCRALILDACEALGLSPPIDHAPNYTRDRTRGAQGG